MIDTDTFQVERADPTQETWVVYKGLDRGTIYSEQEVFTSKAFADIAEAEEYLSGPAFKWQTSYKRSDVGWRGPLPVVGVTQDPRTIFSGPTIEDRLQFKGLDKEYDQDPDQRLASDWVFTGADLAQEILEQFVREKNIQIPTDADPSALTLNEAEHKEVQRRIRAYSLPEVECCLSSDWRFREIELEARLRTGHVKAGDPANLCNWLSAVASDLEVALRNKHPFLTAIDLYHFWTSLQVHGHIAEFCRQRLWRGEPNIRRVECCRQEFHKVLGSYAHEIRSGEGIHPTAALSGPRASAVITRKKRREPHPDPESLFGKRNLQTFRTAEIATGLSSRQLRNLIEEDKLSALGRGPARRITTESLRRHLRRP